MLQTTAESLVNHLVGTPVWNLNNLHISMRTLLSQMRFTSWQLKISSFNIPDLENGDSEWRIMIFVIPWIDQCPILCWGRISFHKQCCHWQFISWMRSVKLTLIPLSSKVNWCGVDEHGEIIRLVGLQHIQIKAVIDDGFVELFHWKYLLLKINKNNV